MIHHGFQYKEGLIIDINPFNASGSCEKGGLYYTTTKFIALFLDYSDLIAEVNLPDDAKIYADPNGNKWKADRIILKNIKNIQDSELWNDYKFCLEAVRQKSTIT
jgi:hypothetical protein